MRWQWSGRRTRAASQTSARPKQAGGKWRVEPGGVEERIVGRSGVGRLQRRDMGAVLVEQQHGLDPADRLPAADPPADTSVRDGQFAVENTFPQRQRRAWQLGPVGQQTDLAGRLEIGDVNAEAKIDATLTDGDKILAHRRRNAPRNNRTGRIEDGNFGMNAIVLRHGPAEDSTAMAAVDLSPDQALILVVSARLLIQ